MWLAVGAGLLISAALSGAAVWWWLIERPRRSPQGALFSAVLDQSPNGVLIVEADSLALVHANEALTRLREPDPRLPLRVRLRDRSGGATEVEAIGHHLRRGSQTLLAFTLCDVSVRRQVEAQLLEEQQHLSHLAHHDQLTGLPNRLYLAHHLPGAIEKARRSLLAKPMPAGECRRLLTGQPLSLTDGEATTLISGSFSILAS